MKIWYQNRPALLDSTGELPGVITAVPEGTVVLADDGADPGKVVSFDPTGALGYTPNHGPYELCTVDPSINVLRYTGSGVAFAVIYRAR